MSGGDASEDILGEGTSLLRLVESVEELLHRRGVALRKAVDPRLCAGGVEVSPVEGEVLESLVTDVSLGETLNPASCLFGVSVQKVNRLLSGNPLSPSGWQVLEVGEEFFLPLGEEGVVVVEEAQSIGLAQQERQVSCEIVAQELPKDDLSGLILQVARKLCHRLAKVGAVRIG